MTHVEDTWPDKFKDELFNLRFNIAIDGINPYSQQDNSYIVWPVVVTNNNIPPWFSINNEHIKLDLIVLGRIQVNNMDVYL